MQRSLDPHRLVGSDEPEAVAAMSFVEHGRLTRSVVGRASSQVVGSILLRVAVGDRALKG